MKRPHLGHPGNDGDGVRQQVIEVSIRLNEPATALGPNRSGYRGRNHRLLSGALGLCLVGVKRGSTARRDTYCCVNVGSATAGLPSQRRQTGLAAADVAVAWQSVRSSLSQE